MRLTTRTDLALRALMYCAVNRGATVRKADIAKACNASLNHLGLVINLLAQLGYVRTTRGRNGGLRLARPPGEISVGAVFRSLESDLPFAECFAGEDNTCPLVACCRLSGALSAALEAFYASLDPVTLADLTCGNCELAALLVRDDAAAERAA